MRTGLVQFLVSTSQLVSEDSQGQNPSRTEAWRQELVQKPWRTTAYWLVLHCLLIWPSSPSTQDHQARSGTAQSELEPPISIISQEKCTTALATGQSGGDIFLIEVHSSHMILAVII